MNTTFFFCEGSTNRIKRQDTNWEEIFVKLIPDKNSYLELYRGLTKFSTQLNNSIGYEGYVIKENIWVANMHMTVHNITSHERYVH